MQRLKEYITLSHWPISLVVLTSGMLLGLGLLHPWFFPLTLIGISVSIWCARRITSLRWLLLAGFCSWSIKFFVSAGFFWNAFPVYWLDGVATSIQLAAIGINWLLTCLSLAVGGALVWLGIWYSERFISHLWWKLSSIGLLWVLGELISSFFYAFVFYGNGAVPGAHFSWGYVGYAVAAIPGLQFFALLGGVYALSFVAVVIGQLLLCIKRFRWWFLFLPIVKVGVMSIVFGYFLSYQMQGIIVATIDTEFRSPFSATGAEPNETSIRLLHEAVLAGLSHTPDYLILPEDARYFARLRAAASTANDLFSIFSVLAATSTIIIDSGRTPVSYDGVVLQAHYYRNGKQIHIFDKEYLTPQGEYLSYWFQYILSWAGFSSVLNQYFSFTYQPGDNQVSAQHNFPALLFCFEASHPLAVRSRITTETPFVVYPISHAWFYNARTLTYQVDMMMRVHAIWNQTPIVSAANMETGKVYYPDGRIEVKPVTAEGDRWQVRVFEL